MKRLLTKLVWLQLVLIISFVPSLAANTIIGYVYDDKHNPLLDVDVELLNDLGILAQHTRTDSTGRYSFAGLADGRFSVKVMPFRYDFEESIREITFSTFSVTGGTGSDTQIVDFTLVPRKNGLAYSEAQVVFAQEVPENAKNALNQADSNLKKKNVDAAIASLEEAIKIFPKYFMALYQLGEIYVAKKEYNKAATYLIVAADVNNKSPRSFYLLGYSLAALQLYPAALISLNQALLLSPASSEVLLTLGIVEINQGKYTEAETHLKQVKKVSRVPNPEVYWQLSQLYGKYLKRYDEAADELDSYIKALPNTDNPEQKKKIEDYKKIVKQLRDKAAGKKT